MSRLPLHTDTSAETDRIRIEIYRHMSAWRKIQLVEDANRTARQLALAGLRSRHPAESATRLRRRLYGLTLGEDLAARVYGPLDETA